jgi:hypothetical protein
MAMRRDHEQAPAHVGIDPAVLRDARSAAVTRSWRDTGTTATSRRGALLGAELGRAQRRCAPGASAAAGPAPVSRGRRGIHRQPVARARHLDRVAGSARTSTARVAATASRCRRCSAWSRSSRCCTTAERESRTAPPAARDRHDRDDEPSPHSTLQPVAHPAAAS